MILLYVPCKDSEEAERISKALIDNRLIACSNIHDSKSFYKWKGEMIEDFEKVIVAKTVEGKVEEASKMIKEMHSYDVPAIIKINADANPEYENWLKEFCLP